MPSRVTQGMLNIQLLRNLNSNMTRMDKLQNQLSTGRKINKPSDDPVGISYSMRYRSELSTNDQFQSNVDAAHSWMDFTDTVLNQAGNVLQRARELAVQGANGTNSQESMDAIRKEIDQLTEQMLDIGNSKFNGKYVFNGQKTDLPPYKDVTTAITDIPDSGKIKFEIGAGVKLDVNVTGDQVFGAPGGNDNVFQIMSELKDALNNNNNQAVTNLIEKIDSRMNAFLGLRADVGAKTNRIELAEGRLEDINLNLQSLKSKTEDADMSEVITNLKMDENVYQASLSAGSKLIKPSLIDFLR